MSPPLEVRRLAIADLIELVPRRLADDRGYFTEVYNRRRMAEAGVATVFVQNNQSYSAEPQTLRGLHFQTPPFEQAKLVWVVRGAAFDVAVDLRAGSPTYGRWASVLLSGERGNQILVPSGFAHGFLTLEPETLVQYMVSSHYSPEHDRGVRFDDPALAIDWPLHSGKPPRLSERDSRLPGLADLETPFRFVGGAA